MWYKIYFYVNSFFCSQLINLAKTRLILLIISYYMVDIVSFGSIVKTAIWQLWLKNTRKKVRQKIQENRKSYL